LKKKKPEKKRHGTPLVLHLHGEHHQATSRLNEETLTQKNAEKSERGKRKSQNLQKKDLKIEKAYYIISCTSLRDMCGL
jgi:hypothetical protein